MAGLNIKELATSSISLTDFLVKADQNGLATKNTMQGLQDFLSTLGDTSFKGTIAAADATVGADGWYFASDTGTYTNNGGLVIDVSDNIVIIIVSATQTVFSKVEIPITITFDAVPTDGSTNAVTSEGIKAYVDGKGTSNIDDSDQTKFAQVGMVKSEFDNRIPLSNNQLFNKDTDVYVGVVNSSGEIGSNADFRYLKVKVDKSKDTDITIKGLVNVAQGYRYIFKDISAVTIHQASFTGSTDINTVYTFAIPDNATEFYLTIVDDSQTITATQYDAIMLNYGAVALPYESFYTLKIDSEIAKNTSDIENINANLVVIETDVETAQTTADNAQTTADNAQIDIDNKLTDLVEETEITSSSNVLNPADLPSTNVGYMGGGNGKIVVNTGFVYSNPLQLTVGQTYYGIFKDDSETNVFRHVCFKDINGDVLAGGITSYVDNFTPPAGTVDTIISVATESEGVVRYGGVGLFLTINPVWEDYFTPISESIVKYKDYELANKQFVEESLPILQDSYLQLNGDKELVTLKGAKYTRVVAPFKEVKHLESRVFNFYSDTINNGNLIVRNETEDDVAPVRVTGRTLLANHSYFGYWCDSVAHGKTDADVGSVYSYNGQTFVLINVDNVDRLWFLDENSVKGDYLAENVTLTYVSGGVTINNISITTYSYRQAYPSSENHELNIFVDGVKIDSKTGKYNYSKNIVFQETYNLITKDSILNWYKNDYDGTLNVKGISTLFNSIDYIFDFEGNCTIVGDYTFSAIIDVQDIMALQAKVQDTLDEYYIPKTIQFNHEGTNVNFSMIESSTIATTIGGASIEIESTELDNSPIPANRYMQLASDKSKGFAMGYLALASASLENRATNTTALNIQIRGNTNKMYPRLVDVGNFNSVVGQSFSYVAYRNIFVPENGATANYAVRTNGDDYYFIDFHNTQDLKQFTMPNDFLGREFEIEEQRNITCNQTIISNKLTVNVDCLLDYGYLVLKIKK